jgi:undecaprenyl-diphosphatase
MMELIRSIDYSVFSFINGLNNSALDFIMWYASQRWLWIPFYLYLAWFLYGKYPQQFIGLLVCVAILITLSDQVASSVIKPAVMRLRPCHNQLIAEQMHLVNGYCGGKFGFVSSHASNSFALATFLCLLFGKKYKGLQWILILWACLVSYSRIYLGVHYPTDIAGGAILGILLAMFIYYIYKFFRSKFPVAPIS